MALSPVEQVRFLIGLGPNSPFNDFVTDEEIEWALEITNGDVWAAARIIAISLSLQLAGVSTRERTGEIEVWNQVSTAYLAALDNFINDPTVKIPMNLFPWSANTSPCNKLMDIEVCDGDNCKDVCGCSCDTGCACNCVAGPTF